MLVIAGALGLVSAGLAVWRFEWFLLGLLAVRPLLDGLTSGGDPKIVNASTGVGLVFIAGSILWLVDRWQDEEWITPSPATVGLFLLVFAAALSCIVSAQPATSAAGTLRLLTSALMFAVLEQFLAGRSDRLRQVIVAVMVATAMVVAWSAWQFVQGSGIDQYSGLLRLKGPFVHANVMAKFLLVVILLLAGLATALRGKRRLAAGGAALLVSVVLLLTYTRSAWVAAFLGVLYLLSRRDRRLLPASVVVVILLFSTIPALSGRFTDLRAPAPVQGVPSNSISWRWDYWQNLLPVWRSHPINGTGLDTIPSIGGEGLQAHNVWIQTLVEMGVVGILGLLAVVIGFVITLRRRQRLAATKIEKALAYTATAVAGALLLMTLSENLLSETTTLWYAAVAMTFGFSQGGNSRDHTLVPERHLNASINS